MNQKPVAEPIPWLMFAIAGGFFWCLSAYLIWLGVGDHYGRLYLVGTAVVIVATIAVSAAIRTRR